MTYEISAISAGIRVALRGRLTFTENEAFRHLLFDLSCHDGPTGGDRTIQRIEFDLGQLEFIDSAGLGLLLLARDAQIEQRRNLSLIRADGQVARMLGLVQFDHLFASAA